MNPYRALIANDGYAATFQSLEQYRTALLEAWPTYLDLENLVEELLAPREIRRDADGHLNHPAMPVVDENVCYGEFLAAFGLECHVVFMEYDDAEAWERYGEGESSGCSYWTPSAPAGDGWSLLSIYDTEDGPQAVFARRKPEAPRYSYRTYTSPYQAKVTRVKRSTGELVLQLDHQVPDRMSAGSPVGLYWHTKDGYNVSTDSLSFIPDESHSIADMANIGYALLQAIATHRPGYAWSDCPSEIVGDLACEIDEANPVESIQAEFVKAKADTDPRAVDTLFEALDGALRDHGFRISSTDSSDALSYPTELTDSLFDVLSLMLWHTGPLAHTLRAGGANIKKRAEDEQAHVLHWLIQLAIQHGPAWRQRASDSINEIRTAMSRAKSENSDA